MLVRRDWGEMGEKMEQIQRERERQLPSSKEILSPEQSRLQREWQAFHAKPSLLRG